MKMNATLTVLLAEDDEDDKEFISLAFQKVSAGHRLHITDNGQEALDYLMKLSPDSLPCLIVLDLNMPILNGLQTLEALKNKPEFHKIPKVVFTTSDSEEEKAKCLSNGATDFLVKPAKMTDIVKTVEGMLNYCN